MDIDTAKFSKRFWTVLEDEMERGREFCDVHVLVYIYISFYYRIEHVSYRWANKERNQIRYLMIYDDIDESLCNS